MTDGAAPTMVHQIEIELRTGTMAAEVDAASSSYNNSPTSGNSANLRKPQSAKAR